MNNNNKPKVINPETWKVFVIDTTIGTVPEFPPKGYGVDLIVILHITIEEFKTQYSELYTALIAQLNQGGRIVSW
jgi:hypothetical protein